MQFELAVFFNDLLADITDIASIKLEIRDSQSAVSSLYMSKAVAYGSFLTTLTQAQWDDLDPAHAHVVIPFTAAEANIVVTNLVSRTLWMQISADSLDSPDRYFPLAAGPIVFQESQSPADATGPVQASNLVPGGASYDGSGNYTLTGLTVGQIYRWTDGGSNDTSIVMGATTYTTDGSVFTSTATSAVMHGTIGATVTATVWTTTYLSSADIFTLFGVLRAWRGTYAGGTQYYTGDLVFDNGSCWRAKLDTLGNTPPTLPTTSNTQWEALAIKGDTGASGAAGTNYYFYVGYATDSSGTGFSTTPSAARTYVAFKSSATVLTPIVGDFAGLWVKFIGADGAASHTTQFISYANQAAMLAGAAVAGDIGKISDTLAVYGLTALPASTLANWKLLGYASAAPAAGMTAADKARLDLCDCGRFNGDVNAVLITADSIYVGGNFTAYGNTPAPYLTKLNFFGEVDPFFKLPGTGFDGAITRIELASDGDIVVGAPGAAKRSLNGAAVKWLWKLNPLGSQDGTFVCPDPLLVSFGADVMLGFCCMPGYIVAQTWQEMFVLDLTGTLIVREDSNGDQNFHNVESNAALGLKLILTSRNQTRYHTSFNGAGETDPRSIKLIDFNPTYGAEVFGEIDDTWKLVGNGGTGSLSACNQIALAKDASNLVVGCTILNYGGTSYAWNGGSATVHRGLTRLNIDGTPYAGWNTNLTIGDSTSWPVPFAIDSQGRVYCGGNISAVGGTSVTPNGLFRLTATGALDKEFGPFNGAVSTLELLDDDRLVVGGAFTQYGNAPVNVGRLLFLHADGSEWDECCEGESRYTPKPVLVATTASITLSGLQTVDDVALVLGDRVLVKNQNTGANNGIYIASTGTWQRAADFDESREVFGGVRVFVNKGTVNGNLSFTQTADDPVVLGTTALVFTTTSTDIANLIHSATEKTPLVDADEIGFWDSVSTQLRKITWANTKVTLKTYLDTFYDWASNVHSAATKNPPVDADEIGFVDSAASWVIKKCTLTQFKAYLKTYFDTLYGGGGSSLVTNPGTRNLFAGVSAGADGTDNVAIGYGASASSASSENVAIGSGSDAGTVAGVTSIVGCTAVGKAASARGDGAVAVGKGATAGQNGTALGANSIAYRVSAGANVAIGYGANVTNASAVAIMATATADGQFVSYGNDVYFGGGVYVALPAQVAFQPAGALGTNIAGANVVIAAGRATGNAAGGSVLFATSNVGGSGTTPQTNTEKGRFSVLGNFMVGATADPTSLLKGVVIGDGTAASANPTTAVAVWSSSGELQYRTSGTNEGAGQTNRVHNRTDKATGVGTDYTLTGATARVDFGTTDAEVTLPTAGTYLILATCQVQGDAVGALDEVRVKLYNSTDAAAIGVERSVTMAVASSLDPIDILETVTVTASKLIQIYAYNVTAARGKILATKTEIKYVRLF